jgi:hypothetical protein
MRPPRIWLAEHLLHFGWAVFGQECDCGYNRFTLIGMMKGTVLLGCGTK